MDGREMVFALIGVIVVTMAFNTFFMDIANNNGLETQEGLNLTHFNKTNTIISMTDDMRNETTFLENVWLLGDVVALVGAGAKAIRVIWEVPGIYVNMLTQASGLVGIPSWVFDVVTAFVWVALAFIIISAFFRFRT